MKSIHAGHFVEVRRDITRKEGPYAEEGERGEVIEVFRPIPTGMQETKPLYAKVRMKDQIKTFRLTSLRRLEEEECEEWWSEDVLRSWRP